MERAIKLVQPGSEGRLQEITWPPQMPGDGELRIRQSFVGVNFIDSYYRTGQYPLPDPGIPGVEGVGTIEAIGAGVTGYKPGQRVVYCAQPGGFSTTRLLPAWRALALPDAISSEIAAASMLRGMTAHMLFAHVFPVAAKSTVLIHASAGGLGGLLTQWAKALGATVIGTVGSPDKAGVATRFGADHVIIGRSANLIAEVDAITAGQGVDFAIDGIGGDRLKKTMACVRANGTVASIGQAAGPIPAMSIGDFSPKRSIRFTRPSIMAFAADREAYCNAGRVVFGMIERGILVEPTRTYPLAGAAEAVKELESGLGSGGAFLLST